MVGHCTFNTIQPLDRVGRANVGTCSKKKGTSRTKGHCMCVNACMHNLVACCLLPVVVLMKFRLKIQFFHPGGGVYLVLEAPNSIWHIFCLNLGYLRLLLMYLGGLCVKQCACKARHTKRGGAIKFRPDWVKLWLKI